MKKFNSSMMFLVGVICLLASIVFTFYAVKTVKNDNSENVNNNNINDVETKDSVVAILNDKNILRSEVGSDLIEYEKEIISTYVYDELKKEFFKDIEVTDSEVELQLQLLKSQVGEEQWPVYLASIGQRDDNSFKILLKESLRQEKYISEIGKTINISNEELAEIYNKNPNFYNIAVLDVVYLENVGDFSVVKDLISQNKSLEEIAKELNTEVSTNRRTYFESEGLHWVNSFDSCKVGDWNMTTEDSGSYAVGKIIELHTGLADEEVKNDLKNSLIDERAYDLTNNEFIEFLKTHKLQIMGEDFPLYEDSTEDLENIENNVNDNINTGE